MRRTLFARPAISPVKPEKAATKHIKWTAHHSMATRPSAPENDALYVKPMGVASLTHPP